MEDGFKTGFEIALEKNTNIKQEVRPLKAFKDTESTCKLPKVDNNTTQEKLTEKIVTAKTVQTNKSDIKKMKILQVSTDSSTTPPKKHKIKPKVNIYRLGDISIKILEILRDCGASNNRDFCNKLNKNNNYVKRYLYNLQEYGLIYRNNENWKWYLAENDNDFFVDLDSILYNIYIGETKVKQKRNNGETFLEVSDVSLLNNNLEIKIKEKKANQKTQKSLKTKQLNLVELLQRAQQDQIERGVVELPLSEVENEIIMNLASWCDKTQSEATQRAYKHYDSVYKFADEIGYGLADVQAALCSLDDKGYVYTVPPNKDKYGKWKIGFTGEFLEKVRNR